MNWYVVSLLVLLLNVVQGQELLDATVQGSAPGLLVNHSLSNFIWRELRVTNLECEIGALEHELRNLSPEVLAGHVVLIRLYDANADQLGGINSDHLDYYDLEPFVLSRPLPTGCVAEALLVYGSGELRVSREPLTTETRVVGKGLSLDIEGIRFRVEFIQPLPRPIDGRGDPISADIYLTTNARLPIAAMEEIAGRCVNKLAIPVRTISVARSAFYPQAPTFPLIYPFANVTPLKSRAGYESQWHLQCIPNRTGTAACFR